jgi:hypothetical protein
MFSDQHTEFSPLLQRVRILKSSGPKTPAGDGVVLDIHDGPTLIAECSRADKMLPNRQTTTQRKLLMTVALAASFVAATLGTFAAIESSISSAPALEQPPGE